MWGNQTTNIINFDTVINVAHLIIAYLTYLLVKRNAAEPETNQKQK